MTDFYEIDFRQVHTTKSGDAIPIRYQTGINWWVHLVDGGYGSTAPEIASFIRTTYGTNLINHMVVTHPDRDHAEGLAPILEEFDVKQLWMLRPWHFAAELLPRFPTFTSLDALISRLRSKYPYIYELEKIALRKKIPIMAPFQGQQIGAFLVLAPSPARYLQLVLDSEKTPKTDSNPILDGLLQAAAPLVRFIKSGWGSEKFSSEPTSAENEMSVVQYAHLCGDAILLTGDAGRDGLFEAASYAASLRLPVPVTRFQVPHHGGRHNLSSELLDFWIGPKLSQLVPEGGETVQAAISSAKEDLLHPRKVVLRALRHRGAFILTTEDAPVLLQRNTQRAFTAVPNVPYPDEQEED
jgi:beta-lactamase superfamily II metal-dependent hydrolase